MSFFNVRGWWGFLLAPRVEVWCEEFSQKRIFCFYSNPQADQRTELGLFVLSLDTSHSKTDRIASGSFDPGSGLVAYGSDRKRLLLFEPSREAPWEEQDLPFGCEEWAQANDRLPAAPWGEWCCFSSFTSSPARLFFCLSLSSSHERRFLRGSAAI